MAKARIRSNCDPDHTLAPCVPRLVLACYPSLALIAGGWSPAVEMAVSRLFPNAVASIRHTQSQ